MSDQVSRAIETLFPSYACGVQEVARLFLLTNALMSEAESEGQGFPKQPLNAVFISYDYLADADGLIRKETADASWDALCTLDAAHATLCIAYLLTSNILRRNCDDAFEGAYKPFKHVKMDEYEVDDRVKAFRDAEREYQDVFHSFIPDDITRENAGLIERRDAVMGLQTVGERTEMLEQYDRLLAASRRRYETFTRALPVFEKAGTSANRCQASVEKVLSFLGRALEVIGAIVFILSLLKCGIA